MSHRAIIIAVEQYPRLQGGLAPALPGTLQAALDFQVWLTAKWNAEQIPASDRELHFLSEPPQPAGSPATLADIKSTLQTIKTNGRNATEEFFFFFSGHGFTFTPRPEAPSDVIIPSDFESAQASGHLCLKLDEIVTWARAHLGPGNHFYFVDACRNQLDSTKIQVSLHFPFDPETTAEAATYVLQSTARGAVAPVGAAFPSTLLAGLRGSGTAKVWGKVRDAMFVRYESLRRYVQEKLQGIQTIANQVYGPNGEGENEAVLARISPVPLCTCTVRVIGATPADEGQLLVTRGRSPATVPNPWVSPSMTLQLEPDNYSLAVELRSAVVDPAGPVAVDMYQDQTVDFRKVAGGFEARGGPPPAGGASPGSPPSSGPTSNVVRVFVPPGGRLDLRNLRTDDVHAIDITGELSLPIGEYLATQLDEAGETVKRMEVSVSSEASASVDLLDWRGSPPREAIASRFPQSDGGVEFSESLGGPVLDADLHLWLALIGGGRVLSGLSGDYYKIGLLPLHDFHDEPPGASPIYVLAGFEDPVMPLAVAVSDGPGVQWRDAPKVPEFPGVYQFYERRDTGPALLSFRLPDEPPYTIATAALPNRATLVTLTLEADGRPRISQFLLPLGHLSKFLPRVVQGLLTYRTPLQDLRFVAQASRAFRKRRDLSKVLPRENLSALLYSKWVDPIGSSLAAYELVRRGTRGSLGGVVANMRHFFPELPDTWALARLNGEHDVPLEKVPLFQDGLRAAPRLAEWLPLPAGMLDYNSPWTAWRGAVRQT